MVKVGPARVPANACGPIAVESVNRCRRVQELEGCVARLVEQHEADLQLLREWRHQKEVVSSPGRSTVGRKHFTQVDLQTVEVVQ